MTYLVGGFLAGIIIPDRVAGLLRNGLEFICLGEGMRGTYRAAFVHGGDLSGAVGNIVGLA